MRTYIQKTTAILLFAMALMIGANTSSFAQTETVAPATNPNVVRVGLPSVKTGAIGEGMNAQELSAAIQNTLGEYLKGSKVELVALEAKLPSAQVEEAKEKGVDYVLYVQVSHKKGGGGGFGKMFSAVAPMMSAVIPGAAGVGGMIAGQVVSTAAMSAASASANVKAKDELTLDIKLQNGAIVALAKQIKAKAKSEGEDIISPMIEQAAQALVDSVAKK